LAVCGRALYDPSVSKNSIPASRAEPPCVQCRVIDAIGAGGACSAFASNCTSSACSFCMSSITGLSSPSVACYADAASCALMNCISIACQAVCSPSQSSAALPRCTPHPVNPLATEWTRWQFSGNAASNANNNCQLNQIGSAFFLSLDLNSFLPRECQVPAGRPFFFPVGFGWEESPCRSIPTTFPAEGLSLDEYLLGKVLAGAGNSANSVDGYSMTYSTDGGVALPVNLTNTFALTGPLDLAVDRSLAFVDGCFSGESQRFQAAGVWVSLPALQPGSTAVISYSLSQGTGTYLLRTTSATDASTTPSTIQTTIPSSTVTCAQCRVVDAIGGVCSAAASNCTSSACSFCMSSITGLSSPSIACYGDTASCALMNCISIACQAVCSSSNAALPRCTPHPVNPLATEWTRWQFGGNAASNANNNCQLNQIGSAFFLSLDLESFSTRECQVPAGRPFFFPLGFGWEESPCRSIPTTFPAEGLSLDEYLLGKVLAGAGASANNVNGYNMTYSTDGGVALPVNLTNTFALTGPLDLVVDSSLAGVFQDGCLNGQNQRFQAAGIWVNLPALQPGSTSVITFRILRFAEIHTGTYVLRTASTSTDAKTASSTILTTIPIPATSTVATTTPSTILTTISTATSTVATTTPSTILTTPVITTTPMTLTLATTPPSFVRLYTFQAFNSAGCATGTNVTSLIQVAPGVCYPDPTSGAQKSAFWTFINSTAVRVAAFANRDCSSPVALQFDVLNCACTLNLVFLPVPFRFVPIQGDATCAPTTTDLVLTKDDRQTTVVPGATYAFSITVSNRGLIDAVNVSVVDYWPSDGYNVKLGLLPSNCAASDPFKNITCVWTHIAPGATVSSIIAYTVTAQPGAYVTNCASVFSNTPDSDVVTNNGCDTNVVQSCAKYGLPCSTFADCCSPMQCLRHTSGCSGILATEYRCAIKGGFSLL
jgi:hypothetical protein